jgi:prenyltransferase beta subunit
MTIRNDMLAAANSAAITLADSAQLVVQFIQSRQNSDGLYTGRSPESDIYYTLFALENLTALGQPTQNFDLAQHLLSTTDPHKLDLVNLASLTRTLLSLTGDVIPADFIKVINAQLKTFRRPDGGFVNTESEKTSSAYSSFVATALYQDIQIEIPEPKRLIDCINLLKTSSGGFNNEPSATAASTTATAAAITTLHHLNATVTRDSIDFLSAQLTPAGGFLASPNTPIPDLLSTATALHAMAAVSEPIDDIAELCLDFIDSLWSPQGAFYGNWADNTLDTEYTFYGLLAIGHLNR